VQKKRRIIARVQCRNIKNDCPKLTCDEPVLLPGRCCKSCPGDFSKLRNASDHLLPPFPLPPFNFSPTERRTPAGRQNAAERNGDSPARRAVSSFPRDLGLKIPPEEGGGRSRDASRFIPSAFCGGESAKGSETRAGWRSAVEEFGLCRCGESGVSRVLIRPADKQLRAPTAAATVITDANWQGTLPARIAIAIARRCARALRLSFQ